MMGAGREMGAAGENAHSYSLFDDDEEERRRRRLASGQATADFFGGLQGAVEKLADKSKSESYTGSTFQFDPDQLFKSSAIFGQVYDRLMRRGLI